MSQRMTPTVVTAPVDVDAAAVGAGELGQREAGGVCWEESRGRNHQRVCHLELKYLLLK